MTDTRKALEEMVNVCRMHFMQTEIDLRLTFVKVALTTSSAETKERNRRNAQAAHDSAVALLA